MRTRAELLVSLVEASDRVSRIVSDLNKFPWDSPVALLTLTRSDVARILGRYEEGRLTADEVEAWANAIEGREDIAYEINHEEVLAEIIHQLANPLITVPLTPSSAHAMMERIG
ncbi:MAG: hypothetical protein SFW64_00435 [Alphaproteobacteria bacterium]|nr:hypothetical protein [Alphaproteobacteria bacterium]